METNQPPASSPMPQQNILMGVLAYIGPLVIVSYLAAKDDPFVKFHIKQGLVLLIIEVAMWFFLTMFWPFWFIFQLINFVTLILAIIGIMNAARGKQKDLPIVGKYAERIPV